MPLDPTYIGSGKVFIDSFALRRGIKKMTTAKYVDGWQDSHFAKQMGVSKKEYKRIVEEFHRSGLLETVDVHAFNPTANRARNIPLEDTRLSRGWYRFRGFTQRSKQVFQNGFDIGERNNVTFTYMLALRRAEKKYGVKDLTKFSRQQWDEIAKDTTNLALGMTRPNKFGYQSGMSGMAMQFLSFSHKAALGLMGGNPALKGKGLKILMSGYLLWGANIFGAEDKARELLAQMGLSGKADAEVLPGIRLSDLMAAGLVESGLNAILTATTEAEKELDIGFMAPGANVISLWESWFEAIAEAPEKGLMGPFHNPASGFLQGLDFGYNLVKHSDRPPVEKLMKFGDAITRFTFTGYNDANRAYFAYTTGKWLSKSGDVLETKPVMSAILARLFLGVRTEEELSSYNVRTLVWEDQDNVKNAVDSNKRFLKELFGGYQGKEYGPEYVNEMLGVLNSMYEEWPEGLRREIFVRSLTEGTESAPSIMEQIGKMVELGGSTNLKAIIPWIETQADIPPQQKAWLVEYVNEQQNQFNQMDEAHLQMQQKDRKAN
jgi:hypothetical protein